MPNKETNTTPTLKERVQAAREQAREILRTKFINNLMQDLFHDTKNLENSQNILKGAQKRLAIFEYDFKKLDTERPDADDQKKSFEENIANKKKDIENCEKDIAVQQKVVDKTNETIAKVEAGETKMSIDEIKEMADELLGV